MDRVAEENLDHGDSSELAKLNGMLLHHSDALRDTALIQE